MTERSAPQTARRGIVARWRGFWRDYHAYCVQRYGRDADRHPLGTKEWGRLTRLALWHRAKMEAADGKTGCFTAEVMAWLRRLT